MKVWIHINGIQEGPYQLEELPLNRINPDTPVWYEGLDYWKAAAQAPEVARLLMQAQAPKVSVEPVTTPEPEVTTIVTAEPESVEAEVAGQSEQATEPVASEPDVSVVNEPAEQHQPQQAELEQAHQEPEPSQPEQEPEQAEPMQRPQAQWPSYQQLYQQPYGQPYQQAYQQPYQGAPEGEKAPTYMVIAILVTILCCNPLAIIAIFTAAATGRRNSNYDFAGAKRMSEATAWWIMIAIVTSLIVAPFITISML